MLRMKTPANSILVSDASALAGLSPGLYSLGADSFDVLPDRRVVVAGSMLLAGAAVFLDTCMEHVLNHGLATLPDAIAMAAIRPRELLGIPVTAIAPGQQADIVVFDWQPGNEIKIKTQISRTASN
jgi:N-acetylglucosamine-6-phosphate deacetylase